MKHAKHALTWRREGSLAIATLTTPLLDVVHDLARVDELFDELDAYEADATVDALLFVPGDDDAPPSTIRGIVEGTQDEARRAPQHGRLSLLRSFNVLSRLAVRVAEYKKLVAVAWRGPVDPVNLGIGLAVDLRVAAEDTQLEVTSQGVELPPLGGLSYLLPVYLGLARAHAVLVRAEPLDASRAFDLSLVDAVLPTETFFEAAWQEVQRLVQRHVDVYHQNRPVARVDANALREHLHQEAHLLEHLCSNLLTDPAH
jgi:enoyl-CoA hydratase/carnithine racemase